MDDGKKGSSNSKRNYFTVFLNVLYVHLISKLPYSPGNRLRKTILTNLLGNLGEGSNISNNVKIIAPEKVFIGEEVGIANKVILDGRGKIKIGDYSLIGFESVIVTSTHNYQNKDMPIRKQGMYKKEIEIGSDVWVGARVMILPGVKIGNRSIIGANSVVTKDIPHDCIYGGVPAKFIKKR